MLAGKVKAGNGVYITSDRFIDVIQDKTIQFFASRFKNSGVDSAAVIEIDRQDGHNRVGVLFGNQAAHQPDAFKMRIGGSALLWYD